ncbi:Rta1 protein [Amylocarpus encephaloides]|uniref:Rta1 protein n=1 Tax=Amylocarpus encephaloides TaxID=45428 RepID=A0A9P8C922_9HELO|nr:Rta1 protein [Amylocarpus encephaloides]
MTLGRIIRCVKGEHLSLIPVSRLTKTFVIGDLLSLSIQGSASNLTTNENPKVAKIGEDLVIAGLFIQLALLSCFFVVGIVFQKRLRATPTRESNTTEAPWKETLYMIYTVSALIFFRSIFRVVEYIQGHDGYSLTHEWTLYVFDAVPMFVVTVAFWWWYPAYIQSAIESVDSVELDNRRNKSGGSS